MIMFCLSRAFSVKFLFIRSARAGYMYTQVINSVRNKSLTQRKSLLFLFPFISDKALFTPRKLPSNDTEHLKANLAWQIMSVA